MLKSVRAMIKRESRPTRHLAGLLVLALAGGFAAPGTASAQTGAPARGDLTVDQAVKLALERNQDLLTSDACTHVQGGLRSNCFPL